MFKCRLPLLFGIACHIKLAIAPAALVNGRAASRFGRRLRLGILAFPMLALLIGRASSMVEPAAPRGPSLEVVGTLFRVTVPSGDILTSHDMLGVVLDAADEAGKRMTLRIDSITQDPADPQGNVWLHRFSVLNAANGAWSELCSPGPDGIVGGFPLAGYWTKDGRHLSGAGSFVVSCTSGAIGKCVRLGYHPWRTVEGESLWDYHQACVRMIRADYGGDGVPHTRDGVLIDIVDRLGIQRLGSDAGSRSLTFEAAWDPNGAVCVQRTRRPEILSDDDIIRNYPYLAARRDLTCSESTPALMWNRSAKQEVLN
jgi:ADYC domain